MLEPMTMTKATGNRPNGEAGNRTSSSELRHAHQLIRLGNYAEALAVINRVLTRPQEVPQLEQARWQVFKSLVFTRQGRPHEGLTLAEQVVASLENAFSTRSADLMTTNAKDETVSVLLEAHLAQVEALERLGRHEAALHVTRAVEKSLERISTPSERGMLEARLRYLQATVLWRLGKFEEALRAITSAMDLARDLSDAADLRASILNRWGSIYHARGDLTHALEYYQQSLKLRKELGNTQDVAGSLNNIGLIYYGKGELTQALEYYQQSLRLYQELGNMQDIATALNNIGLIYYHMGDLTKALEHFQQSLKLSEELGNMQDIAMSLNNIGLIYRDMGNLTHALEYYQKSLKLKEQIGNAQDIAGSLNNIGFIYRERGDLTKALEYFQQSLNLFEELGNNQDIALSLYHIGTIHREMGDHTQALKYLQRSLSLFEETGNPLRLARTLLELIVTALERQKHEPAQQYLQQLEEIARKNPHNPQISQRYRIGKALLLKTRSRARYQFEAQQLFQQVAEEDVVDHELTALAMVNLAELLLLELKTSPNDEVLSEVKHWLGRLLDVAEKSQSHSLLAHVYLLHAKLSLLDLDLPRARQLFEQAHLMAEERGLNRLAAKIATEYDAFLDQQSLWQALATRGAPLSERLKSVDLETMLHQVLHKRVEDMAVAPETPVLLMVLNENGMLLFTKAFSSSEVRPNEHLVASFLAAIESFSNELFATSDMTGDLRVRKSGYTLLLHRHGSVLFCYVFQGGSYHAVHKLRTLIEILRQSEELWNALLTYPVTGRPLPPDLSAILEDHVTRIFASE